MPQSTIEDDNSIKSNFRQSISPLTAVLQPKLDAVKNTGVWKTERIIYSSQNMTVCVANQKELINFSSSNYLGLVDNEEIVEAAKAALDMYGVGSSSARFISGTLNLHKELEDKLSAFHKREDTILYVSGFDANVGIFETLLTADDAVISDELIHASIIDGIRLCKAKRFRYKHKDMADLEQKLKESALSKFRLIVTDGIFSMDGTVAPLPEIIELAKKYNAATFLDDAHGTGVFGKTGRGTEEHFNLLGSVDIINSSLGKAVAGATGGYTTGSKKLIELLRQRSRPYIFSTSLPPPVIATGIKAVELISNSTSRLEKVVSNTKYFRKAMTLAGFTLAGEGYHPICPVMLSDPYLTTIFAEKMQSKGIYVIAIGYPVVPKAKARIRITISAAHTIKDIDKAVDAFIQVGKELRVIS